MIKISQYYRLLDKARSKVLGRISSNKTTGRLGNILLSRAVTLTIPSQRLNQNEFLFSLDFSPPFGGRKMP